MVLPLPVGAIKIELIPSSEVWINSFWYPRSNNSLTLLRLDSMVAKAVTNSFVNLGSNVFIKKQITGVFNIIPSPNWLLRVVDGDWLIKVNWMGWHEMYVAV